MSLSVLWNMWVLGILWLAGNIKRGILLGCNLCVLVFAASVQSQELCTGEDLIDCWDTVVGNEIMTKVSGIVEISCLD